MLETGIQGEAMILASDDNSAVTMKSGTLDVFATPAMIALIEKAAWESVQPELPEGQGTVGTLMNVKHLAATPLGLEVTAKTELIAIDGRKLIFSVSAYDEKGMIGEGVHERFIIEINRFMDKTNSKRG